MRDAVHGRGGGLLRPVGPLYRVPVFQHLLGRVRRDGAEDVRMPVHQLLAGHIRYGVHIESALVLRHAGMQNDLHQQVAQLLAKVLRAALVYRLADLVGLLQHVAPDALVGLLPVPGAALGGAQIVDKGYEVPEVIALFANKIYHTITPSASSFRLKHS